MIKKNRLKRADRRRKRGQKQRGVDDDDYALTAPDTSPHTIQLLKSLHRIGFRNQSRLRVRVSANFGRGLYTTRSIAKHQNLLSMPAAAIVTADRLCREDPSHYRPFFINSDAIAEDKLRQTAALTYFLMRENIRSPQSPRSSSCEWYGPYVNHLFSGARNTKCSLSLPCFWLPHDLIRYGSPILPRRFIESIHKSTCDMKQCYHYILLILTSKMVSANADLTGDGLAYFPYFAVAYQAFTTRSVLIGVDIHGGVTSQPTNHGSQIALIPFFDFLNHRTGAQNRFGELDFSQSSSSKPKLQLKASGRISSRRQVFFSYGDFCNRELFVRYGFTAIRSPPQTVNFDLTISGDAENDSRNPNALSRSMLRVTPTYEDVIPIAFCDFTEWIEKISGGDLQISSFRQKLAAIREANIFANDIKLGWPYERDAENNQISDIIVNVHNFTLVKPAKNESTAAADDDDDDDDDEAQVFVPEKRLDAIMQILAFNCVCGNCTSQLSHYSQGVRFIDADCAHLYAYLWVNFIDFLLHRDYQLKRFGVYDRVSYRERLRVNIRKFCDPDYGPIYEDDDDDDESESEDDDRNLGNLRHQSAAQHLTAMIENEIALLICYRDEMLRYVFSKYGKKYYS